MSSGFGFYNLSVYMNALVEERSFDVADVSGAIAALFVVSGVAGIAVGRLIEHYDVRSVMVAGAAIGALALALIGSATEIWHIWVLFALFGIGNSGVSLVPATTLVTRWFPGANRSIALSVASTGLSAGGVLLAPASANVIHLAGMGAAMPWFGGIYFVAIAPIAMLLVRSWPTGAPRGVLATSKHADGALLSRFFVGTTCAYVAVMGAQVGAIAHLFNHVATETNHVVAATAVSLLAAVSIAGRLLGGFILAADFPIRVLTAVNIAVQGIGLTMLGFADSPASALLGAALFGVTVGNLLMLQPLLLVQAFGAERYPRIFSVANAVSTLGLAGGPLAMGIIHDAANYLWSFVAAAAVSAAALALFFAAGPLPRSDVKARLSQPPRRQ